MDYKVWPCLKTVAVTLFIPQAQCGKYILAFTLKLLAYQVNWTVKDFFLYEASAVLYFEFGISTLDVELCFFPVP